MRAAKLVVSMALLLSSIAAAGMANAGSAFVATPCGVFAGNGRFVDGSRQYDRQAAGTGYYVDRRQAQQRERIWDGIHEGDLTSREAWRLNAEQREIDYLQHVFLADGYLNPYERRRLENELDDASRHISRERHDAQDWGYRRPY